VRGGIIGLGNVAVHGHVPGWLERREVEIVAVSDTHPPRRAVGTERLPAARWFDSAESLLAGTRLDFVDICTPPSSHAPLIRAALERGVHVLCEKPLVRSADELAAVADLARASGCVLHTVHNWHHAPMVRLASELLYAGEIGRPTRVIWHTLRTQPAAPGQSGDDNWRLDPAVAGGGVLSDHGWHVSYVIQRWLGGGPPLAVQARLETRRHTAWPVEDTAALTITFAGAVADVFLTWAADERRNWALIEGETGRIELRDDTVILAGSGAERRWTRPPLSAGSHHPDWFGAAADDFLSEIASGAPTGVNLAEATVCAVVERLARESSRRGGATVTVPPWPPAAPLPAHSRAT
jgi:predicted dehydrogenase